MLDLNDIDVNLLPGHLAQFFLEPVNFRAFASDHNSGTRSQDGDAATIGRALDQNLRHGSRFEFLLEQLTDVAVLCQELAELLLTGEPLGSPIAVHRDAQPDRI